MRRSAATLAMLAVLAPAVARADTQSFDFRMPTSVDGATTAARMRDLAERVLPVYQEGDPILYLARLSALQAVAGDYAAAAETRRSLRDRRRSSSPALSDAATAEADLLDVYDLARAVEATDHASFGQALTNAFRDQIAPLGDREAYAVSSRPPPAPDTYQIRLQQSFRHLRSARSLTLPQAVQLVWNYHTFTAFRSMRLLLPVLYAQDEARRYASDRIEIPTADGATISAITVRPRGAKQPLPALLEFTIDASPHNDAMRSAAHGYAGIVAYTRGKPDDAASTVPFEYDGNDAPAVIDWIAKQSWNDGRVGMYGDGYSGFAAWAAAMHELPALKAIATSSPTAPGIDFPMVGSIFRPAAYRWILNWTAGPDNAHVPDDAQWRSLLETWYRSGTPCGALDTMAGRPNPIYHRWLNHPSFDSFWQQFSPSADQFARIRIPALTITGYFDEGAVGAFHFLTGHQSNNPQADHTLLVGPYGKEALVHGPVGAVRGYQIDAAAQVDLREVRYQWFDYVLKGAPRPALLADRINYQVTESNQWRHAPSIDAMSNGNLRLFLTAVGGGRGELAVQPAAGDAFIPQTVNLADRSDAGWTPPPEMATRKLQPRYAIAYEGLPMGQPLEVSGVLSGQLDLMLNKMDVDLNLALYERLSSGTYVPLFDPPLEWRASYASDRARRRLLRAGERQQLSFNAGRIVSRRFAAGSRLVVVLGVNKRPDREINFGSGKDVRDENAKDDGAEPLKIRLYSGSYIDLPIRK